MKTILVRYGELTLKGKNKSYFISLLYQNIKFKLRKFKEEVEYLKDNNSLSIKVKNDNLVPELIANLQNVFGIYSLSICEKVENDVEQIKVKCLEIANNLKPSTFKLEVSRKEKGFPIGSQELKKDIAAYILINTKHLKVDVHKPENQIDVIVKKDGTYVFTSKIKCAKGLPVGVSGKGISFISGGIDSPVASYLTLKRGMLVNFLHFMTPPHTTPEALQKVFDLVSRIANYNHSAFSLYVCDFSKLLQELMHMSEPSYRITIMRRMFIRIGNALAKKTGASAIITGESLGQVASQTIQSMNLISEVSDYSIIRPVVTYDKEEIIKKAKKIDTYDISIRPFDDVCSLYVPKNPVTMPKKSIVDKVESELYWQMLLD